MSFGSPFSRHGSEYWEGDGTDRPCGHYFPWSCNEDCAALLPPPPDTSLLAMKNQWARIAAERLEKIEELEAELRKKRALHPALGEMIWVLAKHRLLDDWCAE